MTDIRTRFAPSPTGFQHIGGFRTAMYAWLLARQSGGQFILRIEDTDQERKVVGAVKYLIESLEWLGIDVDEGPSREDLKKIGEDWEGAPEWGGPCGSYVQSQRTELYQAAVRQLIESGHAYRCDCTPEMLKQEREAQKIKGEAFGYSGICRDRDVSEDSKHVVRFKLPQNISITLEDGVKGTVNWDNPSLRDPVIFKSDGFPIYHLASVVDDHEMNISHVLRGDEWVSTTPIHLLLYKALGWEPPKFCHLSVILGNDGKKLSKRHGAASLDKFIEEGYLPQAVLNYVALIGWNPGEGEEQEIFSKKELIERFSIKHLSTSGGIFDSDKLLWMNGAYIRNLSPEEFTETVRPFIEKAGLKFDAERWAPVAAHVQERTKLLPDVVGLIDFLFSDKIERDLKAMYKKGMTPEKAREVLGFAVERLKKCTDFSVEWLEEMCRGIAADLDIKVGPAFMVLRIAVTGKKVSPPLFESMIGLGKEETLCRLKETIRLISV